MILQALVRHYEDLIALNQISPPGWTQVKVSYSLEIDEQGTLLRVASVQESTVKGNKTLLAPRLVELPAPVKRTVGIAANFLCDHASYMLGFDGKGNAERARECFAACRALHEKILCDVDTPAANALLAFFRGWNPEQAAEHPALQEEINGILAGANLIFRFRGGFIHEDPAVRRAWQTHYNEGGGDTTMVCLVTGRETSVEAVHPAIKGVQGAQSSGAALVSFNAPAFCSYGKEQNLNAPTGKYAAFAYTSALNHLIADREHAQRFGDTTVVCWAENGETAYQDVFTSFIGAQNDYSEKELQETVKKLLHGQSALVGETLLDPNRPFYILGLAPNAARLSVRFFLCSTFGSFLENVQRHHQRLEIVKPAYDKFDTIPLWKLLGETVNQNTRDKSASPNMAGAVLRSILLDEPYPATLLHGALLRIRAEREVTRGRAAILKAYYLKRLERSHSDMPKEVLTVALNPDCTDIAYTLGRLFSVLEDIQEKAIGKATIRERFFNAASSMPNYTFTTLIKLAQKHLGKLQVGSRGYYERQITELVSILPERFPARLNLPQQGAFQIGYYHQTQKRYEKKEEKENV